MQPERETQNFACCQNTCGQILRGNGDLQHPAAADRAGRRRANHGYFAKLGHSPINIHGELMII